MGRTRPKCMGWADGPAQAQTGWLLCISIVTSPSLFAERELIHVLHEGATNVNKTRQRRGNGMADLRWRRGGAAGGGGTVAGGFPSLSLLCFCSLLCRSSFFFFFSFFFLFLSSLYPLSCIPSPSLLSHFFFLPSVPLPCFYRQKQGGANGGAATVGKCKTFHPGKGLILEIVMTYNRMFALVTYCPLKEQNCLSMTTIYQTNCWHYRYGHLS